ncbi:MAG: extracellular solute-binding protein [Treponema sp.]|jgi:putative aldouronate transport system substrate-binding protein|nr:extracellular solute-binding protein [Treponema sp.]
MKKIAVSVLALALLGGAAFAGGSRSGSRQTSRALPPGFSASGLPIVSQPFTINVMQVRYRSHGADFMNNGFYAQLAKDTNITVNWETRYTADFNEQKGLMFASGDLPEVIFGSTGFSVEDIVNNRELFIPLEDLIDKYMPNLKAIMAQDPSVRKAVTYPDGHIYSLPSKLPGRPQILDGIFINRVWLEKLGLAVPKTTDELYQVLKAFKTRDPNGNGKADEIPWYIIQNSPSNFQWGSTGLFGATDEWIVENGKVIYAPASEQFRQGLEWFAKLYTEGLIVSEYFTMPSDVYYATGADTSIQRFGFIMGWTADGDIQGNAKDFMAIEPPAAPSGKRYVKPLNEGIRPIEMMITAKCPHPEVIARWADQFYTPDAAVQNTFGAFGETTRKEADGSYTVLPLSATPGFDGLDFRKWNRSPADCGPGYAPANLKMNMDTSSGDGLKLDLDKHYVPYLDMSRVMPANAWATVEQNAEKASLKVALDNYVVAATAEWISAGRVGSWDGYLAELKRLNVDRYTAIQQAIYSANK